MISNDVVPFVVAATALLGSPGPAIAALLAVGRTAGWPDGMRFYGGLQLGLALSAAITAVGLFAVLATFPSALLAMSVLATVYLLYLAYKIASSPVGAAGATDVPVAPFAAGTLLGLTNPKAYLAFASLFASFLLVKKSTTLDTTFKWGLVVVVMIVVDFAWLWIGVRLGQLGLSDRTERWMNLALAAAIVLAAVMALI